MSENWERVIKLLALILNCLLFGDTYNIINNKASYVLMGFDSEEPTLGKSVTDIFGDTEFTKVYYEEDALSLIHI